MPQERTRQAGKDENSSEHTKCWINLRIKLGRVLCLCRRGGLRAGCYSSSGSSSHIEYGRDDGRDWDVAVTTP